MSWYVALGKMDWNRASSWSNCLLSNHSRPPSTISKLGQNILCVCHNTNGKLDQNNLGVYYNTISKLDQNNLGVYYNTISKLDQNNLGVCYNTNGKLDQNIVCVCYHSWNLLCTHTNLPKTRHHQGWTIVWPSDMLVACTNRSSIPQ